MIVTSLFFESLLLGCFDKCLFNLESCFAAPVSMLQCWRGKDLTNASGPCKFWGYRHRWTGKNEQYFSKLLISCFPWHRTLLTSKQNLGLFFYLFISFWLESSSKWAADSCSQIKSDLSTSLPASLSFLSRCCQKHSDPWTVLQRQGHPYILHIICSVTHCI